jgi:hypothetical protein
LVIGAEVVVPKAPAFGVSSKVQTELCPRAPGSTIFTTAISGGFVSDATVDLNIPERGVSEIVGWTVRATNSDVFNTRKLQVFVLCQAILFPSL